MTVPLSATGAFSDFFEHAPAGFHILGPDGVILQANRAELEMLGYAAEEYVGHHISQFRVSIDGADDILRRLAMGQEVRSCEAKVRCRDGTIKDVVVDAAATVCDGEVVHTHCITREAPGAVTEATSRLSAIVELSEDAIITKDLDGTIRTWNAGAERIFGYRADEAIGRSIRMLIPEDRQGEEDRVLAALRRGERIEHYETVRQRKDGSYIDISLSVSPVKDASGRIIGASKIARDISERKRAEQAMERSLKLKDEFVGLVSHELRTPIAVIVGNGKLLLGRRDELPREEVEQSLEDLVMHAERLQVIIENLLLLTRMEKAEHVPVEPVHLGHLVETAVEGFRARFHVDGIAVLPGDPAPLALAEPGLLGLVIENLLTNPLKYSPPGSPIEVALAQPGDGFLEVHVLDRGIGLSEEDLEALFTPFYRSKAAAFRAPGMGLGLAVCQRAMTAQCGTILARKREGGGSDFVVRVRAAGTQEDLE